MPRIIYKQNIYNKANQNKALLAVIELKSSINTMVYIALFDN